MFDFSNALDRKKIGPFPIGPKQYVLYQADGEATIAFKNANAASAEYSGVGDKIGVRKVTGIADVEPMLVQKCLFEVVGDKEGPVSLSWVRKLPPDVLAKLFDWIKENTPGLTGQETVESLEKQMAFLTKRLDRIKGDVDPNSQSSGSTSGGSSSDES